MEKGKLGPWRVLASQIWDHPHDPTIYGFIDIDTTGIQESIREERERTGEKITITHVIGKAIADTLGELPHLNLIMIRGSLKQRESVDIFFQVEFGEGQLGGVKIRNVDKKSLPEIARELREKALEFKEGKEKKMTKLIGTFSKLPPFLVKYMLRISRFLSYELGISIGGLERDPFGSAMVTNVGIFGLGIGFAPLFPLSKTPIVATLGKIELKPVVIGDGEKIEPRPVISVGVAIDHRYYDGYHIGILARKFMEKIEKYSKKEE